MSTYPYTRSVTTDTLNGEVEFDSPFVVNGDGTITSGLSDVSAPEVFHVEDAPAPDDIEITGAGWAAWSTGYTGQHGYNGAVLHSSEFLGGGMAKALLDEPGTYVLEAVEVSPTEEEPEPEPAGWVILKKRDA